MNIRLAKSLLVAVVSVSTGLLFGMTAAHAASSSVSGSQSSGTVSYQTVRSHVAPNSLGFTMGTTNSNCGGGNIALRPFNSNNGNIIASYEWWNLSVGTQSHNSYRRWGTAPTQPFKLQGSLSTSCGAGPVPHVSFNGTIYY